MAPGSDETATTIAWYDELRLPAALVAGLHDTGFDEGEAWSITDRVRVLLALPRPSTIGGATRSADLRLMTAWLGTEAVRVAIGVNTWEGVEYLDRGRFDVFLDWAVRLDTVDSDDPGVATTSAATAARLSAAANVAGYRIDRLLTGLGARPGRTRRRRRGDRPERVRSGQAGSPNRIRRSSDIGGAPWPMTDSRWVR